MSLSSQKSGSSPNIFRFQIDSTDQSGAYAIQELVNRLFVVHTTIVGKSFNPSHLARSFRILVYLQ
ncbi:hypothetical protein [Nostoc sp. PCC 7107]|uniref:hypothetical protein n=1 Tax=Nostoc sp. PCC 7107 TaxID=317936 RepID=UPI0002ECF787|nr:hypothetical protein [Nostoc sp. PCC 7107]